MNEDSNFDKLFEQNTELDGAKESFDKEKWLEEKIQQKEDAYVMIDLMSENVAIDENVLKKYLSLSARFLNYGASNTLLILSQRADATELRSFDEWKAADISIKKGEKGIVVLEKSSEYIRPTDDSIGYNYIVKSMFDISQTSSEIKDIEPTEKTEVLKALIKSSPVPVTPVEYLEEDMKCFFDAEQNRIFILKNPNISEMFYALTTEIAHARMQYKNEDYNRYFNDDKAQCISYVLAVRYGFNSPELPGGSLDMFSDCDTIAAKREILKEITSTAGAITHSIEKFRQREKLSKDER